MNLKHLLRVGIDHPHPGRTALRGIIDHAVHDAEGPESQAPRFARCGERRVDAAEVRERDAPPRAVPAQVALLAPAMIFSQHGQARVGDHSLAPEFGEQDVARLLFGGIQRPWCLELAVGHLWEILPTPLNSDEFLDIAPPRSQILVPQRPIDAVALFRICFEVEITPAVYAPPPHDRATSNLAPSYPVEGLVVGKRVRIVEVVDEELGRPLVAGARMPLDGLIPLDLFAVAHASIALFPRKDVLDVVHRWINRPSRFEHDRA